MEEKYCEITKQEADLIGKFQYETGRGFDPFCGLQVNGNYIISNTMYEKLKYRQEFSLVDFSNKTWKVFSELNFYIPQRP